VRGQCHCEGNIRNSRTQACDQSNSNLISCKHIPAGIIPMHNAGEPVPHNTEFQGPPVANWLPTEFEFVAILIIAQSIHSERRSIFLCYISVSTEVIYTTQ
jgi:hypothetical protein